MDILKLIRQDHKEAKALVTKLIAKAEGPSQEIGALARELATIVLLHTKSEERALYEMCEAHGKHDLRAFALEARIEHKLIEIVLKRLVSVTAGEDLKAAAEVVKDLLEHHTVEEEEETIFPKLQKAFSDAERATMARIMVNAKSNLRPRVEAMFAEKASVPGEMIRVAAEIPMQKRPGARRKNAAQPKHH